MADGMTDGTFGGDEAEAREAEATLATADTTAMAVALDIARTSPEASREAAAYLKHHAGLVARQTQLAELQLRHFKADRRTADKSAGRKRFSDVMKNTLQALVTLAALCIAGGIAVMIYDAFTSRAVVVEAFETPPALAASGISGKVVASSVLDALQKLANATRGLDKGLAAQSAWSSDVQIDVPETGVSIGEVNRLLHLRFGHDLHVSGDLIETAGGGLALTVRGDDVPPRTFAGGAADLGKLTTQAAEYVYGRSQPFQYAMYLESNNRDEDALAFLPGAFADAQNDDLRQRLANIWGNSLLDLNRPAQAAEKFRLAIALDEDNWVPRANLLGALALTEGEEAAWRASEQFLRDAAAAPAGKGPSKRHFNIAAQLVWDMPLYLDSMLADAARNGGAGTETNPIGPEIADLYALMHDPLSAERYMAASDPTDQSTKAEALLLQAYAALDRNDAAAAVPPIEAFWKAWRADANLQTSYYDQQCYLCLAYGMAGRLAEAEALFRQAGAWNRCAAFHGDALARAGDLAGANRVWAEGQRLASDLPFVDLYRGTWSLRRGDLAAAAAEFSAAHDKAPHFADPLKSWGDALSAQGRWKEALAKYDEAVRYAPNWAALKQARDTAARKG
jgi:hypothetical protein